jgi:hypothetical protein
MLIAVIAAMLVWIIADSLTTVICHVSLEPQPLSINEIVVTARHQAKPSSGTSCRGQGSAWEYGAVLGNKGFG